MGSRLANEVQSGQMSLYESDSASASQTDTLWLLPSQLNFGKRSVSKIPWHNHLWQYGLGSTHFRNFRSCIQNFFRPKLEYAVPIWSPYSKLQINQVEKVQRTAARWTCRRWRNTSSVGEMLDELEWPSLEARRDRSSLLLFHKIHSGAVSIEKDKYLTPARSLKSTRSSHSAQYCRYQTYSDALKNSLFPGLFHSGIVFLLRWSIPRLLRSLGHSSFS